MLSNPARLRVVLRWFSRIDAYTMGSAPAPDASSRRPRRLALGIYAYFIQSSEEPIRGCRPLTINDLYWREAVLRGWMTAALTGWFEGF
jgi:hypothetical protein